MRKTIAEMLKTWYAFYFVFWSAGQWGEAILPLPIGYAAIQGQFLHLPWYLFLDYFNQSLTTRSPERGFLTSITLALHFVSNALR